MTITFPLPTELQGVGRVVGRFIVVTPDTVNDVDVYPEARGATGSVTFTPSTKLSKTADYAAFVGHPAKTFPVDAYGIMQDEELTGGVWLREDVYTVSYNLSGLNIASHTIEVTSGHTEEDPLVLSAVGPADPPTGSTLIMLQVPAGAVDGQLLSWSGTTGLVWAAQSGVSDASTTVKGIVELATNQETIDGTDPARVVTPTGVKAALDAKSVSDMSTFSRRAANLSDLASAAVARANLSAQRESTVDVRDHGAVGNGVANDTTALQAALATGKNVYIPEGTFLITSPLVMDKKQIVCGAGMSRSTIYNTASTAAIIMEGYERRSLCNLQVYGGAADTAHGIEFRSSSCAYVSIDHVRVYQVAGHGIYGGHVGNVNNIHILDCEIQGCGIDGINLQYGTPGTNEVNAVWITNNNISANTRNGITFFGNSVHITENTIQANSQHGVSLGTVGPDSAGIRTTYGSAISRNYFENNCQAVPTDASVIGLYVGYNTGSAITRQVKNFEVSGNFLFESGAKYRSLIHVTDIATTTDYSARHSVIKTRNNFGKMRLLTASGSIPLSYGCTIDEDNAAIMTADLVAELPSWVGVRGNFGVQGAPPRYTRIVNKAGAHTIGAAGIYPEAGQLIRMTNATGVNVTLTNYSTLPIGHGIDYLVTGAGTVTFLPGTGVTILGNAGPHSTGALLRVTKTGGTPDSTAEYSVSG